MAKYKSVTFTPGDVDFFEEIIEFLQDLVDAVTIPADEDDDDA